MRIAGVLIQPTVYILASKRHGTIHIGVTSDLVRRVHQHREGLLLGFTRDYRVRHLVHFELHKTMEAAIAREKRLKGWRRACKIELIEERHALGDDLAITLGLPRLID